MFYQLVMKKANNNYQPFDLKLFKNYEGEDLTSIIGIDNFTTKYKNEDELKKDLLEANFINIYDLEKDLLIVYYENEKWREEKFGLLFQDDKNIIAVETIINFLKENINNPQVLNIIYNKFNNNKYKSMYLEILLDVLKNIKVAIKNNKLKNINAVKFLPYIERRNLGIFINQRFSGIIKEGEKNEISIKRRKRIYD